MVADCLRYGPVAEWLCRGLQILLRRFDSGPGLQIKELIFKKDLCIKSCIAIYPDIKSAVVPGSSAVEQAAVNRLAGGSNPSRGAKPLSCFQPSHCF